MMDAVVLAHQGGWDEALLVAAPVLVLAGIVWNAKRREVNRSRTSTNSDDSPVGGESSAAQARPSTGEEE